MTVRPKHIVLLGDMRGTKHHLSQSIDELEWRIGHIQSSFSRTFFQFAMRSRSMSGYTFSDSVVVEWRDTVEGARYVLEFAKHFWQLLDRTRVSYRIFVDEGLFTKEHDVLGEALNSISGRLIHILPVSLAVWSVYAAESGHFPEGVFVGISLKDVVQPYKYEEKTYTAGPFSYVKIIDQNFGA